MLPLFGAGPGEYLDLATFNFQVPRAGSAAYTNDAAANHMTTAEIDTRVLLFHGTASLVDCFGIEGCVLSATEEYHKTARVRVNCGEDSSTRPQ